MNDELNTDGFIDFDGDGDDPEDDFILEMGDTPHVIVQASTGASQTVLLRDVDGEPTVSAVMANSGLSVAGSVSYFVDGNEVNGTFVLADGQTLTVIGNVKGA